MYTTHTKRRNKDNENEYKFIHVAILKAKCTQNLPGEWCFNPNSMSIVISFRKSM